MISGLTDGVWFGQLCPTGESGQLTNVFLLTEENEKKNEI